MQIDEDTHLSLRSEERVIGSVPLRENVPSKSVCPISRSDRKNLAVHVSLSSIFTMSKSRPWEPLSRAASLEAALPNFWEQESSSGCPAAPLPFPEFAAAGRKAVVISEAGYMRGPFLVSTPENDKTDKKRNAGIAALKPAARLGFRPTAPTRLMWEAGKNFQETGQTESVAASPVPNTRLPTS